MKAKQIVSYQCTCAWVLSWTADRKSLTCINPRCPHYRAEFAAPDGVELRRIGILSSEDSAGL